MQQPCRCHFKVIGYSIGWFGVISRILGSSVLAIQVSRTDDDLFATGGNVLVGYGLVSLAINLLFIVGVNKENHHYLVPYLALCGIEVSIAIGGFIGGVIFFVKFDDSAVLYYFVPCFLIALGVYLYLWWCLMRVFRKLKQSVAESGAFESEEIYCSCTCFETDSLDVATPS